MNTLILCGLIICFVLYIWVECCLTSWIIGRFHDRTKICCWSAGIGLANLALSFAAMADETWWLAFLFLVIMGLALPVGAAAEPDYDY